MESQYEVIIIGAGVAGLSCAIYSARANLKTLVIETSAPGGKLTKIFKIENYPGFKEINGADLAVNLFEQAQQSNAEFTFETVVKVEKEKDIIIVKTEQNTYTTKNLVIATGTVGAKLNVEKVDEFTGRGISYCAVCDGNFYKGKDVIVLGQSERAIKEAIYLANVVKKVTLITPLKEIKEKEQLEKNDISIIYESVADSLEIKENKIVGLKIKNIKTNQISLIETNAIFPCLTERASNSFVSELGITDEKGFIKVNENRETIVENVYAAGDIIVKDLRQVVTAASDGAICANSIIKKRG